MSRRWLSTSGPKDPLFNYTSGHWICNDSQRLAERHLVFDVSKLLRVIAKAVNKHPDEISNFQKIAEGGSYRVFEAVFEDKLSVIARLPYPCLIPRSLDVSSEVATMDFLKKRGLPIPKIYRWDATDLNPVGSAYMIMEKVQGRAVYDTWYTMSTKERQTFVEEVVKLEKHMFDIKFPASGSIYYKQSLDSEQYSVPLSSTSHLSEANPFCIGPSSKLLWWYRGREVLPVHKGPWSQMQNILKAPAEREREWLKKHGVPRLPREPLNREVYDHKMVDPHAQIQNLSKYLDLVPWLVPRDEDLHRPVLRHPDLSPSNIFISDEGAITGLIDWQHCAVMPLSLHSRIPEHFQNWGDEDSESFHLPTLPANNHALTAPEKDVEYEKYRRRQLHNFYVGFTALYNKDHSKALQDSSITEANKLFEIAGHPWEGDNASLKAQIIRYTRSLSLPSKYSEAEEKWALDTDEQQKDSAEMMQTFRNHIGCNVENWVPAEDYEIAMQKAGDLKAQVLANAETDAERDLIDRDWPFQDHEEVD